MTAPTPGYKTVAFWAALLLSVISALSAAELLTPGSMVSKIAHAIVIALAQLGYTAGRSAVQEAWQLPPPAATPPQTP